MRKPFKWLLYTLTLISILIGGVIATAYWNRDKLLAKLNAELNKGINGKVHISKIDFTFFHNFPNFSVTLHDVYVRDAHYEKYRRDIFSAEKIFVDLGIYPLLKNEVKINALSVDNADIFVFKARNGDTNTDVLKKSQDSVQVESDVKESSLILNLDKISFHHVSVGFADSIRQKFINFHFLETNQSFVRQDSGFRMSIKGQMHFDSLFLNPKSGSYLNDKTTSVNLNADINRVTRELLILPSTITYNKNEIGLEGRFETKKQGEFALSFNAANINVAEVKTLLNPKLIKTLSKFNLSDPVTVGVHLQGIQIPGNVPAVDVEFETKQDNFQYKTIDFSSLALKGSFTNHIHDAKAKDNENSKVTISSFKGLMEKIPIAGKVTFTDLHDPIIDLSFTSKGTFKDINAHIDNTRLTMDKGDYITQVSYRGKLSEYLDSTRTSYQGKLNGTISASNVSLHYKEKKIHLDNLQMNSTFNEKVFTVQQLNLNVNGSPVTITGNIQNFIPFFIKPENKGNVKLKVHSPNFDLTSFTTRRTAQKKSKAKSNQNLKKMSDLLDMVYNRLEFDIDLTMGQFKFRKFYASNFKGRLRLDDNLLQVHPLSMEVAGGTMSLNFSLKQVFDPISPMSADAEITNANIHELFVLFNNFNQKTINADHLSGKISADVKFSASVDDNYTLLTPTMRGTLDCKITNGELKNFEPMENMSNFLFKKRDFSDVQFAELNSNFTITGTDMDISRMEIQSSVLSLFLQGRYSFTDSTSLSVQLPLSNLKKRHKDFKPKNIGTDKKAGASVYLHVYRDKDVNSKIQIDYDPFKKWVKN